MKQITAIVILLFSLFTLIPAICLIADLFLNGQESVFSTLVRIITSNVE